MMKKQMAAQPVIDDSIWINVYQDGQPVDRLIAHPDSQPISLPEGMQFTDSFGVYSALTERHYRTPLSIEATLMTDSTNMVLVYEKGQVILNWDRREDLLHVRHPVTGEAFNVPGLGSVPTSRWHQVEWVIAEDVMRLLVNGEERFVLPGNYRGLQGPIGVRTGWQANLRVGTLAVTEFRPAEPRPDETGGQMKDKALVLPGYRPVPHDYSWIGCLMGAMQFYNRYIDESDWLATTGLAFAPVEVARSEEDIDLLRLSDPIKLLGVEVREADKERISDLLAEGVPLMGRLQGQREFMAITGCMGPSLRIESVERGGMTLRMDELSEGGEEPEIYSIHLVDGEEGRNGENSRKRMESAFRWAAEAGGASAHAYAEWLEVIMEPDANPAQHAQIATKWRKAREHAARYLERAMDHAGPSSMEGLREGSRVYQSIAAALREAEGTIAAAVAERPSGHQQPLAEEGWRRKAAEAIRRAAEVERSALEVMRQLADGLGPRTLLKGLRYHGISCMSPFNTYRGITDYYGISCSDAWLRGVTGRPFLFAMHERINVHDFCIPMPERRFIELFGNIGLDIDGVDGASQGDSYRALLRQAWDAARKAIDAGWACFGRSVDFLRGEYSLIHGYDRDGYYTSSWHGPMERAIPWEMYGLGQCPCEPCTARRVNFQDEGPVRTLCRCDACQRNQQKGAMLTPQEEGEVRLYWAKPRPAPSDRLVVREALQLAVEFADPAGKWAQPEVYTGSEAYDVLIHALDKGLYDGWYLGLHANAWQELRCFGWEFLIEAKERFNDPALSSAFDTAIGYAEKLKAAFVKLNEMFPWMQPFGPIPDAERRYAAADLMRSAKQAEMGAIQAYRTLVELL
ncbi:hypothetical protein [Paenibacillus sp. J2TS4]|uniref:hypothetical protein n=1 Tax=Paenibacillus sp. J2TS4 TaxID=2807194 RepID=UPI001B2E49D6|nr:hypothetical protein [Paenibacillus sp. J2TS4]GIP34480.1 hypothetical protein J2TS4_36900 [Paenibacillus sp. J2TS4]